MRKNVTLVQLFRAPAQMIRFPRLCSIIALLLLSHGTVSAAPILDQVFAVTAPSIAASVANNQSIGQTFTVGLTGLLTSVDVQIFAAVGASPPLLYEIVELSGGLPAGVLASGQLPSASAPSGTPVVGAGNPYPFTSLDFPDFFVTAGTQLAILLRQPLAGSVYGWFLASPGGYSSGTALANNTGSWVVTGANADQGFRTYVDQAAVPEPATMTLLAFGLAGVGARRWRRRRA